MKISSEVLFVLILLLLSLLLIFAVYLSVLSLIQKRNLQTEQRYVERSKNLWVRYLFQDDRFREELIPQNKVEMKAAESLLITILKSVYIEGTTYKISQFANQYMTEYYRKMLHSKEWSIRMNALYRVLDFRLIDLAEQYLQKTEHRRVRNSEERYYLTLVQLMTGKVLTTELIKSDAIQFSEQQNRDLLMKLTDRQLQDIQKHYDYLSREAKLAFFDVVAEKQKIDYEPSLVEQLSKETDKEIKIRLLKTFEKIGYVQSATPFISFLNSEEWEERLIAAKLIGTFPIIEQKDLLLPLLEDKNWWVRSTVAGLIAKQKNGLALLRDFQQKTLDPYAADVISEQLGKKAVV